MSDKYTIVLTADQLTALQNAIETHMENADSDRKNGVDMTDYDEEGWDTLAPLIDKAWTQLR